MTFLTRVMNAFHTIRQERYTDGVLFNVEEQGIVRNPWRLVNATNEGSPRFVEVILPIGFDIAEYERDLAIQADRQGIGFARTADGIIDLATGDWEHCTPLPPQAEAR
jgi:hypothetical protein